MTAADLVAGNHPARFWRFAHSPAAEVWAEAAQAAVGVLPEQARGRSVGEILARTLGEGQFGAGHWTLPAWRRVYERLRAALPPTAIRRLRRAQGQAARRAHCLGWPIEDRYRRFLWDTAAEALRLDGRAEASFAFFWPGGLTDALVLTHDIETATGQEWAARVADLEERLGLRSAFNFVSDDYALDRGLIRDLQERGFEVGIHGLRHDGHEFASRQEFARRAELINRRLADLGAVGFRAPLTHRQPVWMQWLRVEYDASFFDTDPFEPIAGGTMSLWPFLLGRFVELPYTLPQDHTLWEILGEHTPALWLTKRSYLARWFGMALVNTHPDYLRLPSSWAIYEEFLSAVRGRSETWYALPRDVARWWRWRATATGQELLAAPAVARGEVRLVDGRLEVRPPPVLERALPSPR